MSALELLDCILVTNERASRVLSFSGITRYICLWLKLQLHSTSEKCWILLLVGTPSKFVVYLLHICIFMCRWLVFFISFPVFWTWFPCRVSSRASLSPVAAEGNEESIKRARWASGLAVVLGTRLFMLAAHRENPMDLKRDRQKQTPTFCQQRGEAVSHSLGL